MPRILFCVGMSFVMLMTLNNFVVFIINQNPSTRHKINMRNIGDEMAFEYSFKLNGVELYATLGLTLLIS